MFRTFELWANFFALQTVGDLRRFSARLDASIPEQAALAYYISTWSTIRKSSDDAVFTPSVYLSRDRTTVMYGNAPVIFEGTNRWSWKPYLSREALVQKLSSLHNVVTGIRDANPNARIAMLLIPEKDYVISRFLLKEDRFRALDAAVDTLRGQLAEIDISLMYDQPFFGIEKFQSLIDFEYKDSHLAGRNYVTVFGFVLEKLGVPWDLVKPNIELKRLPEFGDLAIKFSNGLPNQAHTFQPNVPDGEVSQTAGSASFADPLGDSWQEFKNSSPLVSQSVCLLGDSHSSIYAQRKLTYLFANTFRDAHFEWNPCGIRKRPGNLTYDNIVLEISSRFVV